MTRTRDKLNEAQYFLNRMEETQKSANAGTPSARDAFKYDLNAFITAARSVTYVMQKDFKRVPGFEDWYEVKQDEMRNDEVMLFFHKQRNITIHQGSIEPIGHTMITVTENLGISDSVSITETNADGTEEKVGSQPDQIQQANENQTEVKLEQEWFFDKFLPNNVLTVCNVQITKLRQIVNECESQFSISKD
jgi:hypothetical protein